VTTRPEICAWLLGALSLAAALGVAAPAAADDPPEWSTPVKPFRIAGNVYYVGTQGLAAYLIVSNRGGILLDGTTAENALLIERNIEAVGVPLHTVRRLICDHAHADHVGALAQIIARHRRRVLRQRSRQVGPGAWPRPRRHQL